MSRRSRRNRYSKHFIILSGELLSRFPLLVAKDKNHRPIQLGSRIFVAVGKSKTACCIPSAIVRSDPVRACTHDHSPNTTPRFLCLSLCQLIREHEERGLPQRGIVVRHQSRFNRLKKYCVFLRWPSRSLSYITQDVTDQVPVNGINRKSVEVLAAKLPVFCAGHLVGCLIWLTQGETGN